MRKKKSELPMTQMLLTPRDYDKRSKPPEFPTLFITFTLTTKRQKDTSILYEHCTFQTQHYK